jgi:hypothetical protein
LAELKLHGWPWELVRRGKGRGRGGAVGGMTRGAMGGGACRRGSVWAVPLGLCCCLLFVRKKRRRKERRKGKGRKRRKNVKKIQT